MKHYIVTGAVVTLHAGKVHLTPHQASIRQYALTKIGEDLYEITGATQFKKGEAFDWDGDIPKSMADQVFTPKVEEVEDKKHPSHNEHSPDENVVVDKNVFESNEFDPEPEEVIHKHHHEPHHGKNKKK